MSIPYSIEDIATAIEELHEACPPTKGEQYTMKTAVHRLWQMSSHSQDIAEMYEATCAQLEAALRKIADWPYNDADVVSCIKAFARANVPTDSLHIYRNDYGNFIVAASKEDAELLYKRAGGLADTTWVEMPDTFALVVDLGCVQLKKTCAEWIGTLIKCEGDRGLLKGVKEAE
jgi:hypothetical protein